MYSYWWRWLLTWPTRCWSLTFSKWLQRITHNSNGNTQQQQQQQQKEPNSGAKPFIKTMPMLTTNQCNYQAKLRLCSTPLHTPHSTPIQSNPRSTRLDANFQLLAKRPKRKERRHRKKQKKTDGTLNMHPVCAKVAAATLATSEILCHQRRREEAGVTNNYFAHGWLLPRRWRQNKKSNTPSNNSSQCALGKNNVDNFINFILFRR